MAHSVPHKQRSASRSLYEFLIALLTGIFSFLYFYSAARLDPDPHHDGYILASALAAEKGLLPHSQYFAQYGPIPSTFYGLVLRLDYAPLLSIRIANAVLLALTSLMLVVIFRQLGHMWIGVVSALLWSSTSPDWTFTSEKYSFIGQWPWPNVLFVFINLIALSLLIKAILRKKNDAFQMVLYLVSGAMLAVALISRITLGVPTAAIVFGVLLVGAFKHDLKFKNFLVLVLGFGLVLMFFGRYIYSHGIFEEYLTDTLIGPSQSTSTPRLRDFLWVAIYPTIGAMFGLAFIALIHVSMQAKSKDLATQISLVLLAILGFALAAHSWLQFPNVLPSKFFVPWEEVSLFYAQVNLPTLLSQILIPIFALVNGYRYFFSESLTDKPNFDLALTLVYFLGAVFLLGSYPIGDLLHVWWSSPLAIALLVLHATRIDFVARNCVAVTLAVVVPFVLVGTTMAAKQYHQKRVELRSPALNGMKVLKDYAPAYAQVGKFMKSHSNEVAVFMCADGLISVWNGWYQSPGADFVSWSFSNRTSITKSDGTSYPVVFCSRDEREVSIMARTLGLKVIDRTNLMPAKTRMSHFANYNYFFAVWDVSTQTSKNGKRFESPS